MDFKHPPKWKLSIRHRGTCAVFAMHVEVSAVSMQIVNFGMVCSSRLDQPHEILPATRHLALSCIRKALMDRALRCGNVLYAGRSSNATYAAS